MGARIVHGGLLGAVVLCSLLGVARAAWADDAPPPDAPSRLGDVTTMLADVTPPAPYAAPRLERDQGRLTWYVGVEGGISLFEDPKGILGPALPAGNTPFDWGANSYDSAFAARLTVGRHLAECQRLEFRGSWSSWDAESSQTNRRFGYSQNPGGALILSPPVTATLENETDLWSFEINWWRTTPPRGNSRLEYALGARVIRLEDTASATNFVGLAPGSFLRGEADNTLWAAQGAVAWRLGAWQRFELGVSVKGMLGLLNRDLSERDASIVTGGPTTNASRERTDFGWALEGEVQAIFRPVSRVGITATYSLLLMGDMTRAHEMLDLSRAATGSVQIREAQDNLVVHSLFLGVRIDL